MTNLKPFLTLAEFTGVSWSILAAYFALMFFVGFAVSRGKQNTREYFLAGRSLPTWALAVSIVATTLSATTFIGVPDQVYTGNISYLATYFGTFIAVFIVGFLFVPRLYRAGTVTIYGYLRPRFGDTGVTAVSCAFLVGRLLASGVRLFTAALPLTMLLFGFERPEEHRGHLILAICMIGCIGIFYTVKGGIRAVVWTDTIQLFLVIGAVMLTIVLLLNRIPLGAGELVHALGASPADKGGSKLTFIDTAFDPTREFSIWACLLGATWLNMATYGVDQDFAQRFMVSKSATRGALSVIGSQVITVLVVSLFITVGLLLYVFYRRPDLMGAAAPSYTPQAGAYPQFLLKELHPVFAGLAMAGLFAVAQGSMDSAINAMASSAVADLYLPLRRRLGYAADESKVSATPKVAVALIGGLLVVFAIALAFQYDPANKTLLNFALGIMPFAFAGMLGVFLTALFTSRGNAISCISALIAGAATIALLQDSILAAWTSALFGQSFRLAWPWWMPIGTAVSFAVCVAGRPRASVGAGFPVAANPPAP